MKLLEAVILIVLLAVFVAGMASLERWWPQPAPEQLEMRNP